MVSQKPTEKCFVFVYILLKIYLKLKISVYSMETHCSKTTVSSGTYSCICDVKRHMNSL